MAIESIKPQTTPDKKTRKNAIKLPPAMRPTILKLLADARMNQKGYEVLSDLILRDYNVIVEPNELKRLRAAYGNEIAQIRKEKYGGLQQDAKKIRAQADALLKKRLTRAFEDESKRDALKAARDAGAIDDMDYKREIKKLPEIPTSELIKIANHFTEKPPANPPGRPALPEFTTPPVIGTGEPAPPSDVQKALAAAIERGDTVELQRILYSGTPKPQSSTNAEATE